tara:strand:- start:5843 stop:6166 length:324 start_codon:yes stop_codon:yes gene_type:complete
MSGQNIIFYMERDHEFRNFINKLDKNRPVLYESMKLKLYNVFKLVPSKFAWIKDNELYYDRKMMKKIMNFHDKYFIITSFERSLKHCGMKVKQTTHGKNNCIKIWAF